MLLVQNITPSAVPAQTRVNAYSRDCRRSSELRKTEEYHDTGRHRTSSPLQRLVHPTPNARVLQYLRTEPQCGEIFSTRARTSQTAPTEALLELYCGHHQPRPRPREHYEACPQIFHHLDWVEHLKHTPSLLPCYSRRLKPARGGETAAFQSIPLFGRVRD